MKPDNMRLGTQCVVVAAALALGHNIVVAQQDQPPIYRLGEIVVSSQQPMSERATAVRIVTAEQIAAAGARTLDEALALVPGLDVRTGGQGIPRIDFRGFRPRHVLLLLDGIPFNASWDGQADPSFIPVENIALIKVTPGTGSVL
jgi:outer membrane cobalamin receptor